mgnify:FL=1
MSELAASHEFNPDSVSWIRVIDVVGSIDPKYASFDSEGNIINDPWPTPFPSSGFDLDAVGAINLRPLNVDELNSGKLGVIQFRDGIAVVSEAGSVKYFIWDLSGRLVDCGIVKDDWLAYPRDIQGIYLVKLYDDFSFWNGKIFIPW